MFASAERCTIQTSLHHITSRARSHLPRLPLPLSIQLPFSALRTAEGRGLRLEPTARQEGTLAKSFEGMVKHAGLEAAGRVHPILRSRLQSAFMCDQVQAGTHLHTHTQDVSLQSHAHAFIHACAYTHVYIYHICTQWQTWCPGPACNKFIQNHIKSVECLGM